MNFKIALALFAACIFLSSCGVKNDPIPPGGVYMPSVEESYMKATTAEEEQKKENDKTKKESK